MFLDFLAQFYEATVERSAYAYKGRVCDSDEAIKIFHS